jgi:ATP-binding cassette, subfamily G (WHITE), member 2, PDR
VLLDLRGVSGGERKRVSIAEVLACRAAITCWDNSTRGLDANTALEYVRSLRLSTDLRRTSATLATLYQVSETIYDQFDRVLLVDGGRCVYYGPRDRARRYFQGLGYYAPERQTTADFLTSVTDPNEVIYDNEYKGRSPRTAEEREIAWKRSSLYADLLQEFKEVRSFDESPPGRYSSYVSFPVSWTSTTTVQRPRMHTD